jgi:calcineurin-like phosphoesterase family protein
VGRLAGLDGPQLSILAGHLTRTRTRCRRQLPAALAGSYGIIRADHHRHHQHRRTRHPHRRNHHHQLHHATRRATLIHAPAAALRQPPATGPQAPGTPAPASA